MKKLIFTLAGMLLVACMFAQVPQEFTYQAVLRDADGAIIAGEDVTLGVDILQGSATGTSVFTEQHNVTTTEQGVINLHVGSLTDLSTIAWQDDVYFIQISLNGTVMGTSQLVSVPYALYAKETTITGDEAAFEGWDRDTTNELQMLRVAGDTLFLSDGNYVILPDTTAHAAHTDTAAYAHEAGQTENAAHADTAAYAHESGASGTPHYADTAGVATSVLIEGDNGCLYTIGVDASGALYAENDMIVCNGIVAYYPFNGNAMDESPYSNHGTVKGASLTTDRFGNSNSAYSFDGNDTIAIDDSPQFDFNQPLTVAAWVNPADASAGGILGHWGHGGEGGDAYMLSLNDGYLRATFPKPGLYHLESTQTVPTDSWTFVCLTYDGNTVSLFINNSSSGNGSFSSDNVNSAKPLHMGLDNMIDEHMHYLNGAIDDVRIYKRVLEDSEISQLYHEGGWTK